jgi:hypothetical protein
MRWTSNMLSCTSTAIFTGAFAGGCVGLHGIVGMGLGIAAGIVTMMVLRRLRRRWPMSRRARLSLLLRRMPRMPRKMCGAAGTSGRKA